MFGSSKLGYIRGKADLGVIELILGYTPPVILSEGTFNIGDKLEMQVSGIALNLGLSPCFQIDNQLGIRAMLGYALAFSASDALISNAITVPMESPAIVLPNGLNQQAGINPRISTNGLIFQLGVTYNLDF